MVTRWAILKDGIVQNVCLWDGNTATWQPPEGCDCIPASDLVAVGWSYDGQAWVAPVPVAEPEIIEPEPAAEDA